MLPSLVFQQIRQISTALRSALAGAISNQGKYDFEQRVLVDNHKRMINENFLRRGPPNLAIDEPVHPATFGDGEGSASPYFRSRSGDAAVLVSMVHLKAAEKPRNEAEEIDQPWLLLTHRSYFLRNHRGEMSYPGGRIEKDESIEKAALREGFEEINIPPASVTIWSQLRPSLTRNLKNNVTPVVGVIAPDVLPLLRPQDDEVQSIYLVPLSDLVQTRRYTSFKMAKHKYTLPVFFSTNFKIVTSTKEAYFCPDNAVRIWGLSGVVTDQTISCLLPPEVFLRENHTIIH